mgnify:CR=1 FL=1
MLEFFDWAGLKVTCMAEPKRSPPVEVFSALWVLQVIRAPSKVSIVAVSAVDPTMVPETVKVMCRSFCASGSSPVTAITVMPSKVVPLN